MSTKAAGPYGSESKADAWLFEHSKFLRKHFSPKGPTEIPSKHDLVQERAAGEGAAFPRESKIDAALFEHSKFLRKHVKHDENLDGEIHSKHAMLRESLDGGRPSAAKGAVTANGAESVRPGGLRKTMRDSTASSKAGLVGTTSRGSQDNTAAATTSDSQDRAIVNGMDYTDDIPHSGAVEDQGSVVLVAGAATTIPAWQAANDNERTYGDEASLYSAASPSLRSGPGLIEHRPTVMESTSMVGRPVPHSLQSNSAHARYYDEATGADPKTHAPIEHPMER